MLNVDPFMQLKCAKFPTLFAIAMDYLPIQASVVPCEHVFSSSAKTNTKRRNRIGPTLMEALQMLKFYLKKKRLNFTEGWVVDYRVLVEDDPEVVELSGAGQELDVSKIKAIIDNEEKPLSSEVSIYK